MQWRGASGKAEVAQQGASDCEEPGTRHSEGPVPAALRPQPRSGALKLGAAAWARAWDRVRAALGAPPAPEGPPPVRACCDAGARTRPRRADGAAAQTARPGQTGAGTHRHALLPLERRWQPADVNEVRCPLDCTGARALHVPPQRAARAQRSAPAGPAGGQSLSAAPGPAAPRSPRCQLRTPRCGVSRGAPRDAGAGRATQGRGVGLLANTKSLGHGAGGARPARRPGRDRSHARRAPHGSRAQGVVWGLSRQSSCTFCFRPVGGDPAATFPAPAEPRRGCTAEDRSPAQPAPRPLRPGGARLPRSAIM